MFTKSISYVLIAIITTLSGCGASTDNDQELALQSGAHMITITEMVPAKTYTYMKVTEDGAEYWAIYPQAKVEVGKTYFFKKAHPLYNFNAADLNRTFDKLYLLENLSEMPLDLNMSGKDPHQPRVPARHKTGKQPPEKLKLDPVDHTSDETTISTIYANPQSFEGKRIKVRGKVVKFNDRIMGRNWVHIQDGTEYNGKFDLAITTKDMVNKGETVVFEGSIQLNRDFGAGYTYDVIMENARLLSNTKL